MGSNPTPGTTTMTQKKNTGERVKNMSYNGLTVFRDKNDDVAKGVQVDGKPFPFEKIKQMSNEELCDFLDNVYLSGYSDGYEA